MEERLSWIWTRSEKLMGATSHAQASINPIFGDSWEEQAFAEDASGGLGGCIWPPRSYSCSFCRREFRSAQALGGHMNVHRRDRARLKQLPSPHTEIMSYGQDLEVNKPIFSHVHQYPSWVGTEVYKSKAQEQYDDGVVGLPMSTSTSILEEHQKKPSILLSSWSNISNDKSSKILDLETRTKKDDCDDETIDLSINLNLVDKSRLSSSPCGEEKEFVASKKRRIESSLIPLIISKPTLVDYKCRQSEELEYSPSLLEGLDLELRLGDPPKVK